MLRVTVELVPFGDETKKKEIAKAIIFNDTKGTREYGSYGVRIAETPEDTTQTILESPMASGGVKDYPRLNMDVWPLVLKSLQSVGYK